MGTLIVMAGLLFITLFFDLRFRLAYYLAPGNRFQNLSRLQFDGLRSMLAVAKTYAGFRIIRDSRVRQRLPDRFLIIANHQSLVDIPVLSLVFPRHNVRFVAKKELKWGIPSFSFALRKGRHALISRDGDYREAHRELVKLARLSRRERVCPVVFPEGTRTRTGKVKRFHSAAVRTLLKHAPLPAVTVAINGGYRISRLKDLVRNLRGCAYRVRLLTLYPPPRGREDVKAMIERAHDEIKGQVEEWTRKGN